MTALPQAFCMIIRLENHTTIGALALKDLTSIMQSMGQRMRSGISPVNHLAIHPDNTISVIKRN